VAGINRSEMDQASYARQLHFWPQRAPLGRGNRDCPGFEAGMKRMKPVDAMPCLDLHKNNSMREPKTQPPLQIDYSASASSSSLSDTPTFLRASLSRASLWDTGSRSIAYPSSEDDCWAFGGVKHIARSRDNLALRPRLQTPSSNWQTTSMAYGGHWEDPRKRVDAPPPPTSSLSVLQVRTLPMHQAQPWS